LAKPRARVLHTKLDLHDLRLRFGGYETGTWFYIDDAVTDWAEKVGPRPYVLIAGYSHGANAFSYPRSTSGGSGIPDKRHPPGHAPRCRIDKDGRIVPDLVKLNADWLREAFMCKEPDVDIVKYLTSDSES
jgi:hypothetical protein